MKQTLTIFRFWLGWMGWGVMVMGGCIIIVQAAWISYGVMMRYVFRSPDSTVTEATALLLFPVAFAGLVYAMQVNAYPRVTVLIDRLSPIVRRRLEAINCLLIVFIAGFFALAATQAAWRDFHSGAASEILLWPRFLFWIPAAVSLLLFTLYGMIRAAEIALDPEALDESE